jgi:hypothetical protein
MNPRPDREPPAPSALDEYLSAASLRSSPWVLRRLRELRLEGHLVKGWTPPVVRIAVPNESRGWGSREAT